MKERGRNIMLGHGSGEKMMHELIRSVFLKHFSNPVLDRLGDSALIRPDSEDLAFTTDSFVVDPLFFPGGNIGKLAVCGTVNDLAVAGAEPKYISVSFIIEEGFPVSDLENIVRSVADESYKAGIVIATGDTKVVNRGKCDKLFINTAGVGVFRKENIGISEGKDVSPGDVILINGTIGDHGMSVMNARESFNFSFSLESDCASLNHLIRAITAKTTVKFMRDPTRGGVAATLTELAERKGIGVEIDETSVPFKDSVKAMCEILGFDPFHIANEGKVIVVASEKCAGEIIRIMKTHETGRDAAIIGRVVGGHPSRVVLKTKTGGSRYIDSLSGDQLPRIC